MYHSTAPVLVLAALRPALALVSPPGAPGSLITRVPSGPPGVSSDPPVCPPPPLVSLGSLSRSCSSSVLPRGRCAPPLFALWHPPAVAPAPRSCVLVWPSAVAPPHHGVVVPAGCCTCSFSFSARVHLCVAVL
jgi:hypothetical protein